MSWKEQLEQYANHIMTNVNTQLAVLQFKVDTLVALALVGKAAKEDHVYSQLFGLMDQLVIRAENMNQSTYEFNEFKKQQEMTNISMQKTLSELKSLIDSEANAQDTSTADSNIRQVASLKAKLSECQLSEERARIQLARKTDELNAARLLARKAQNEIGYFRQQHSKEIQEIKEMLRKANFACQQKSEEIKELYGRLSDYEDENGYPYY